MAQLTSGVFGPLAYSVSRSEGVPAVLVIQYPDGNDETFLHEERCWSINDFLKRKAEVWEASNSPDGPILHAVSTAQRRYESLKTWLLDNGIIRFHKTPLIDSEPFVMGEDFYGPTFEAAVDTLPNKGK